MIREFKDFDLTIKDLINFVTANKDTLLLITADHETGGLQLMKQKDDSFIVQWGTGSHTGVPVGVYAYGPGSQNFSGVMDNTDIFYKILEVLDYQNLTTSTCALNND
jgi:alkaline phosphatase